MWGNRQDGIVKPAPSAIKRRRAARGPFSGYAPRLQGLREALHGLGNGYLGSRAAAPDVRADATHYPGTYLAGCYNRLATEIAGREVTIEDVVNLPNWLPLARSPDVLLGEDCCAHVFATTLPPEGTLRVCKTAAVYSSRDAAVSEPGEAARWTVARAAGTDALFVFPVINLRAPQHSYGLLAYRHRRLEAARAYAAAHGYRGAMYPWQSGSAGLRLTALLVGLSRIGHEDLLLRS